MRYWLEMDTRLYQPHVFVNKTDLKDSVEPITTRNTLVRDPFGDILTRLWIENTRSNCLGVLQIYETLVAEAQHLGRSREQAGLAR